VPGPPPKKEAERRRRNKSEVKTTVVDIDALLAGEVESPDPPTRLDEHNDKCSEDCEKHTGEEVPTWHPIALEAYYSLMASGQVIWMEPSDWATAYALCEMLSRELKPKPIVVATGEGTSEIQWVTQPVNGAVMNAFLKGWSTSLMATEGDRRKLRIELERRKRLDAAAAGDNVVSIAQKRADAFKGA
jgi:hypothetical protein